MKINSQGIPPAIKHRLSKSAACLLLESYVRSPFLCGNTDSKGISHLSFQEFAVQRKFQFEYPQKLALTLPKSGGR
jgi:hypothetical protein